jgi:hypothetical protein
MCLLFYYMKRNVCHDEMAFCIHQTSISNNYLSALHKVAGISSNLFTKPLVVNKLYLLNFRLPGNFIKKHPYKMISFKPKLTPKPIYSHDISLG